MNKLKMEIAARLLLDKALIALENAIALYLRQVRRMRDNLGPPKQ